MSDPQLFDYWISLTGLQRRNFLFVVFTVCGQDTALHVLTKTAVADIVADETKGLRGADRALAKERDGMADAFTAYLDMQKRVEVTEQNLDELGELPPERRSGTVAGGGQAGDDAQPCTEHECGDEMGVSEADRFGGTYR